jgi:hypothetical protein
MAFNTTSLAKARELYERANAKVAKIKEDHSESIGEVIRMTEITTAAMAMGYVNGRFGGEEGELAIAGIPVDLTLGLVLHGAAFTKIIPDQHRAHGHNLGTGVLAGASYRYLAQIGKKGAQKAQALHPQAYPSPQQLGQGAVAPPPWTPLAQTPQSIGVPQGMPHSGG